MLSQRPARQRSCTSNHSGHLASQVQAWKSGRVRYDDRPAGHAESPWHYELTPFRVAATHFHDVFISYAREDREFVAELSLTLHARGRKPWVDMSEIPLTADYQKVIDAAIEASRTFVFIISPDSLASVECRREVAHAVQHCKRLLPLLRRGIEDAALKSLPEIAARSAGACRRSAAGEIR